MDIIAGRTLGGIFEAYTRLQPEKIWLVFEDGVGACRQWTYAEFDAWTNQTAAWLLKRRIGRGARFTVQTPNTPAFVALALAASKIGAVMVPADPAATADELGYVVEHSESRLLVGEESQAAVLESVAGGTGAELVYARSNSRASFEGQTEGQPSDAPHAVTHSRDVVHMLYTSGTTSRPKGVLLTNASFIYGAEVMCRGVLQRSEDRHLVALPLFHAAAPCHALWPTLLSGGTAAIVERFSASRFFEQAIRHEATLAALFAAPLRYILATPEDDRWQQNRLRNVTFAQNLTEHQYDEWHRRFGAPLQQLWGMTETVGLPIMSPPYGERNLLAMGRSVVGYEVRVVDARGEDVGPDEDGELIVRGVPGRSLMLGYYKNAEATAAALRADTRTSSTSPPMPAPCQGGEHLWKGAAPAVPCWLYTGDTVRYDPEGWIYFVDRGKDLIKRAGKNIAPAEIEAVIKTHPDVADCAVIGVPDAMSDERVVAFIIPRSPADALAPRLSLEAITAFCRGRLSDYKMAGEVQLVSELPRTSVGKVQKHLLRARWANAVDH